MTGGRPVAWPTRALGKVAAVSSTVTGVLKARLSQGPLSRIHMALCPQIPHSSRHLPPWGRNVTLTQPWGRRLSQSLTYNRRRRTSLLCRQYEASSNVTKRQVSGEERICPEGSREAHCPIIAFHSLLFQQLEAVRSLVRLLFNKTLAHARSREMQFLRPIFFFFFFGQRMLWNRDLFGFRTPAYTESI